VITLAELAADLTIPVSAGLQAQGDLLVVPLAELAGAVSAPAGAAWVEVPPDGLELLRGNGGNAHTLVADPGTCLWTAEVADVEGLALGLIDALATVYLMHREHGGTGLAAGRYVIRRQRELAPPARSATRPAGPAHRDVPRAVAAREAPPRIRYVAD
jgi:hypothetical protein